MAKYNRIEVALKMRETGVVPVFYHSDPELSKQIVKACYDGGIRIFEFTNRGDFAHEVFAEINKYALSELPGMIMGVGSVVDPATAALYIQLGANFIVSPLLNEEMAKICNRRKVAWSPGCATVSEVSKAEELGSEVVKIFPANLVGGAEFIKSIKGPMPWSSIMPSGGVSPEKSNLETWFKAGAYCVGMGSNLITKDIVVNKKFELLTQNVKNLLSLITEIKSHI